ncbi:serine-rich adhesin for platelets-like [Panonychus citri]|uniref:serine-rich adhesin for platelets-like n=1 Tax=Panonychus citri TaxID=50023 RepID=UPI002308305B|nr:serine-rich adhesin for platelets-like [Panonychus citri]
MATSIFTISLTLTKTEKGKLSIDPVNQIESVIGLTKEIKLPVSQSSSSLNQPIFSDQYFQRPIRQNLLSTSSLSSSSPQLSCYSGSVCKYADDIEESSIMCSDEDDVTISSNGSKARIYEDVNDSRLEFSEALDAAVRGNRQSSSSSSPSGYRRRERGENIRSNRLGGGYIDTGAEIEGWRERTISTTPEVISKSDLLYSRLTPSNYGSEGLGMFTPCSSTSSSTRTLSRGSIESSLVHRPVSSTSELESGWGSQEAIESTIDDRPYMIHTRDRGMLTNYDSDERSDYSRNLTSILIGMEDNRSNRSSRISRVFGDIEEAELEVEPSSLGSSSMNSLITTNTNSNSNNNNSTNQRIENTIEGGNEDEGEGEGGNDFDGASRRCDDNMEDDGKDEKNVKSIKVQRYLSDSRESNQDDRDEELEQIEKNEPQVSRMERNEYAQGLSIRRREKDCDNPEIDRLADREKTSNFDEEKIIRVLSARRIIVQEEKEKKKEDDDEESERDKVENDGEKHDKDGKSKRDEREHERVGEKKEIKNEKDHEDEDEKDEQDENEGGIDQVLSKSPSKFVSMSTTDSTPAMEPEYSSSLSSMNSKRLANILLYPQEKENNNTTDKKKESVKYTTTSTLSTTSLSHSPSIPPSSPPSATSLSPSPSSCSLIPTSTLRPRRGRSAGGERRSCSDPFGSIINNNPHSLSSSVRDHFKSRASITVPYSGITISRGLVSGYLRPSVVNLCGDYGGDIQGIEGESKCNENEEKQNRTKPTADDNNNEKSSDFSKYILKSLKESSKLPKCQQSSSSSSNPTTSSSNVTTSSTSTSIKPTNLSARSIRIARQKLDPDSLLSLLRPQQNDNRPSSPPPPPPPPPPQPFPVILPYSNSSSLSTSPLPPPPTSPLPLPLPPSNSSLPTLQSSSLPETLSSVSMVRSIVPQTITMFPVSCTTQTRDSYTSPQVCSIGLRQDNCSISTNTEIDMELMNRILDKILAPKVSISIQTEDQSSKPIKVRKCRDASVGTEKFSRERFSALPETRSKHTQTECSWLRNKSKAVSTQDDDSSLPITLQSSSPTESRPFRGIVRIVRDRPYKLTKNINIQTDLPIRREMILSDRKSRKLSSYNDNRKIVKIDDEDLEEEKEIFVDTETEKDEDEDDEDGDDSYFEEKDEIQKEEEEEDGDNLDSVSSQSKLTKQVNQSTQISSSFPSSSSYSLTRSPTFDIINNTIKRRPKVNTAEKVKISKKQKSVQTEPLTMIRGIELPLPGTETRSVSRATSPTTNTIDDNYSISRCSSRQLMISPEHRVRPIRESNINQNKPQSSLTRSNVEQINNQRSSINNIVNYGNTIRSESNRSRPLRSPSLSPSRSPSRSSNQLYRITSQNPVMMKQQQSNEKLSSQFEPHQQPSIQQQHNYYNHQHQQQQNQHRQTEQTPIHQQANINNHYHQQRYSNDPILQQQQQSHQPFSGMAQPQTIDQQSVPIQSIPVQAPVQVHTPTPAPIPIPVSVSVPNSALGSTSETKTPTSGIVNKDTSGNQTTDLIVRPYPSQPNESLIKSFGQQLQTHSKVIVSINKPSQREVSEVSSITTMDRNGKLSRKTQVSTSRKVPVFTGLNSVRNHEDDQETQSTVTQPVITSPTLSKATFPSTTVSPLGKKYFQPTATTTTISASSTRPSSALENLDQNFDNNHNTKIQQDDNYYIQSIDDDIESNIFSPPPPISPLASHPSHHSIQPIQPIPRQSIPLSSSSSINRVTDPLHILINEPEQQHDNQPDDIALPSPAQSSSSSSSLSSTPLEIHYPQSTAQTGYHKQLLPPHSTDQHTDQSQSHQDQHEDQHQRSTSSNRLVQTSNSTNPILVTAANRRGIKGPIIGITWEEASSSTICSEMSTEPFKDSAGTLHRPKSVSLSSETVIGSTGKDTKVETRSRTSRRYADNCIIEPDIKSETIVTDSPPFPITNTCSESNNRNVLPSNSEDSHRPPLPPTTNQPSDQNESSKPPTQSPTSPSKI